MYKRLEYFNKYGESVEIILDDKRTTITIYTVKNEDAPYATITFATKDVPLLLEEVNSMLETLEANV